MVGRGLGEVLFIGNAARVEEGGQHKGAVLHGFLIISITRRLGQYIWVFCYCRSMAAKCCHCHHSVQLCCKSLEQTGRIEAHVCNLHLMCVRHIIAY